MRLKLVDKFTDFGKGFIAGIVITAVIFGFVAGLMVRQAKVKEIAEYAQRQQAIELMREDYVNRDPDEFIDTVPGVRGAADGAATDFERKRDEAVERFRSRLAD